MSTPAANAAARRRLRDDGRRLRGSAAFAMVAVVDVAMANSGESGSSSSDSSSRPRCSCGGGVLLLLSGLARVVLSEVEGGGDAKWL